MGLGTVVEAPRDPLTRNEYVLLDFEDHAREHAARAAKLEVASSAAAYIVNGTVDDPSVLTEFNRWREVPQSRDELAVSAMTTEQSAKTHRVQEESALEQIKLLEEMVRAEALAAPEDHDLAHAGNDGLPSSYSAAA